MILTICPNPSIDCTIELDNLNVGRLNRISSKVETYSGKALNVAKGVARLGEKSLATGFMFSNHAKLFEQALEKDGVDHSFVYSEGSARVNYKIIDKRSMLTEINDKGDVVTRDKQIDLIENVKGLSKQAKIAVMSGSLPKGVSPDFYREVLSVIPKDVIKIVDTETENMNCALASGDIFMVKPNLRELEQFSGGLMQDKLDIVRAARKYIDKGVKYVLVSLGADGAILTDGKEHFYCKSANVAINSTVGAGDSMVAAVCTGLVRGEDMQEILRMSVAAGTASITTSGTNLFYRDKYEEIYAKISVQRLK